MGDLIKKNKEVIMYLIFGVLTTLVNIVTYAVFTRLLNVDIYVSNTIAWILSVLFAYITNRRFVFNSKATTFKSKMSEMISFYVCRLVSFGIDMLLMYIMTKLMGIDDMISKIVVNIVVIVLNYIFSKIIVFRNNER